jgi:uncharacterized protein YjbJ (UPF0337 family)
MNIDTIKSDWSEIRGKIKSRFGKLSDESIDALKDNMELLSSKLQSGYGYAKEHADKEFEGFKASLHSATEPSKKVEKISPLSDSKKSAE